MKGENMKNITKKLVSFSLGLVLSLGVGVSLATANKSPLESKAAGQDDWVQITSLDEINATDSYVIGTNDKTKYLNGTFSSSQLAVSSFSSTTPSGSTDAGVIKFETNGENIWKIKFVSTGAYLTATKASSKAAKIDSESDNYGWLFLSNSDNFDCIYQAPYYSDTEQKNCYASLRSYNNGDFRTYQNKDISSITHTNGDPFTLFKYQAVDPTKPSLSFSTDDVTMDALLTGETYTIPYTVKNVSDPKLDFTSSNANVILKNEDNSLKVTAPTYDKITEDTSFTVTAKLTSTSDATVDVTKELTFKVLKPVLELALDTVEVRKDKDVTVAIKTLKNLGDNPTISVAVTGECVSYAVASDKTSITFTGNSVGSSVATVNVKSEDELQKAEVTITVNVTEFKTENGYFKKVTSLNDLTSGSYLLVAETSSYTYAFGGADAANSSTIVLPDESRVACEGDSDAVRLVLTPSGTESTTTEKYFNIRIDSSRVSDTSSKAYENNNKYLGALSGSLGISGNAKENAFSFDSDGGLSISYSETNETETKTGYLRFNASSGNYRFRYYASGQTAVSLYKYVPVKAVHYAEEFNAVLTEACSDVTADNLTSVKAVWSDLATLFNNLDESIRAELKAGTSTDETVKAMLAKYDHIVKRYGLVNFIQGETSSTSPRNVLSSDNNTLTIAIIVIVSLVSVSSIIGTTLIVRKRKEN